MAVCSLLPFKPVDNKNTSDSCHRRQAVMADGGLDSTAKPASEAAEQRLLRRRQELHHWQKNAALLRRRNLITGLAIGTFVVGMCILHRVLEMFNMLYKLHSCSNLEYSDTNCNCFVLQIRMLTANTFFLFSYCSNVNDCNMLMTTVWHP